VIVKDVSCKMLFYIACVLSYLKHPFVLSQVLIELLYAIFFIGIAADVGGL